MVGGLRQPEFVPGALYTGPSQAEAEFRRREMELRAAEGRRAELAVLQQRQARAAKAKRDRESGATTGTAVSPQRCVCGPAPRACCPSRIGFS